MKNGQQLCAKPLPDFDTFRTLFFDSTIDIHIIHMNPLPTNVNSFSISVKNWHFNYEIFFLFGLTFIL